MSERKRVQNYPQSVFKFRQIDDFYARFDEKDVFDFFAVSQCRCIVKFGIHQAAYINVLFTWE